jgi:hypothetical protein
MRLGWLCLCFAAASSAFAACAVDGELTCGAPCADASSSDGGADVTVTDSASDTGGDVATDVAVEGGCKGDGGYCQNASTCCSGACNQNGKCTPSCVALGSGCSGQTCCIGSYCSSPTCVQCKQEGATCAQDYECCGGNSCQNGDAGMHCVGN